MRWKTWRAASFSEMWRGFSLPIVSTFKEEYNTVSNWLSIEEASAVAERWVAVVVLLKRKPMAIGNKVLCVVWYGVPVLFARNSQFFRERMSARSTGDFDIFCVLLSLNIPQRMPKYIIKYLYRESWRV